MGVTQEQLALTSGTGLRFISDLENGKPTCQFSKVLTVLYTLGATITLEPPYGVTLPRKEEPGKIKRGKK